MEEIENKTIKPNRKTTAKFQSRKDKNTSRQYKLWTKNA